MKVLVKREYHGQVWFDVVEYGGSHEENSNRGPDRGSLRSPRFRGQTRQAEDTGSQVRSQQLRNPRTTRTD